MASLIDLLRAGQLGPMENLPPELQQILAPMEQQTSVPGVGSAQPPMGMVPQMPPAQEIAPRQQAAAQPYTEMQQTAAPMPQPAPQSAPAAPRELPARGFTERLRDVGRSVGMSIQDREAQNETYRALLSKGLDETTARAVVSNPQVAQQVLPALFGSTTTSVKPGEVIVGKQGNVVFDNRERQKPNIVPAGSVALDPVSNKIVGTGGLTQGDRSDVQKTTDQLETIRAARDALVRAKGLSPKAFSGVLAGPDTALINNLPEGLTSAQQRESAQATAELNNISQGAALQNAKANGGARVTVYLDKAFQALAPNASMPPPLREKLLDEAIKGFNEHESELRSRIEGVKTGDMYKPGQTPGAGLGTWNDLGNGVRIRRVQ